MDNLYAWKEQFKLFMHTCYQSVMGFKQLESEVPVEEW
jgi:hypothetical protein